MERSLAYKNLVERARDEYKKDKNDPYFMWADSCKEINLWTYWQGKGHYSPKILLVGQDWGCANTEKDARAKQFLDNVKEIEDNHNEDYSYFHGLLETHMYVTDENLEILFSELGYKIQKEREYEDLFFTNLCLGYRKNGNSGNFETMWKAHKDFDMECFAELIEILRPKIILCLGRSVYKGVMQSMKLKPAIGSRYNSCIEKKGEQPPKKSYDWGEVAIFPLAHPGSLGTMNRNSDPDSKGLDLQIKDWKRVRNYIKDLEANGQW